MALSKVVLPMVEKAVEDYVKEMEEIVKGEVHVRSGALRDSITTEKKGEGRYLVGVDADRLKADPRNASGIDYSVPYNDGHKTYTIRPKTKKALRWIGADGKVRFAKSVTIPASAGDPFIKRAVLKRPKI